MNPSQRLYFTLWAIIITVFYIYTLEFSMSLSIIVGTLVAICFRAGIFQILEDAHNVKQINYINITAIVFGFLLAFAYQSFDRLPGLSLFIVNNVIFHMGEMLHVAFYKYDTLCWNSFLINHSPAYNAAMALSLFEYALESYFWTHSYLIYIGVAMTFIGHLFRIGAFINAKQSFHHQVQTRKAPDHVLVKTGIYAISRHPSYFGFWIYSLGQQVILLNPISFLIYVPVLYKFFIGRIEYEEEYLIRFFGDEYVKYKEQTSILIPFIERFMTQNIE